MLLRQCHPDLHHRHEETYRPTSSPASRLLQKTRPSHP
jgi:hypothetical protein